MFKYYSSKKRNPLGTRLLKELISDCVPAREPRSNLMALAAMSGEGASSPTLWGPRGKIIPVGRRRREMAKIPVQCRKAMASPQAGWLHPALGCQLHHPRAARAGRWSPSSKHYFPVSENLCGRRGKKKEAKETFWQEHKGAVLLQN